MVCSNNSTRTKPQKAYNPFDEDEPGNTPKADPSLTIDELMARKPAGASTAALDELGTPRNGPKPGAAEEDLNPNEPRLDLPQLATGQQGWLGCMCRAGEPAGTCTSQTCCSKGWLDRSWLGRRQGHICSREPWVWVHEQAGMLISQAWAWQRYQTGAG